MLKSIRVMIGGMGLTLAVAATAQAPIYYPSKGQTKDQQSKDEGDCYVWAKGNTGIDPAALAATPTQTQKPSTGGSALRGGAGGAAAGAALGAIAGNAGKGAAIGGTVGAFGGIHRANSNQAAANQQAQADRQQEVATFYRAQAACMSGRGYTVM